MKSIDNNISNEIIINKSKFITKLYIINNKTDVINILNDLEKEYNDASHICYAYILDSSRKCSDNGEPSGTAGQPILNVLDKNGIDHVLCAVIRYFGGIKLGAGGLLRAYSNSCKEALDKTNIIELNDGYKVRLEIEYDNIKNIDNILKDSIVTYKEYNDTIIYEATINIKTYDLLNCKKEIIKKIKTSL